ncbi:MAG: hypothetical protein HZC10_01835 [Nitrospirae bacterium]|nr:hypothetical protein [Nitrospirota bacterium]
MIVSAIAVQIITGYAKINSKEIKMSKLSISLIIGIIAGVIDIAPMIIQKLDKYACISAFVHWVILGIVISYIEMPLSPWLKGIIISLLSALPIVILVSKEDPKSIIPIFAMSIILGAGVGIATAKFAN